MTIVTDASMTIAWLFDDERTDRTNNVLVKVAAEGAVVPSLWRLEVANVLRNAARRGRCDTAYVDRSLERLGRLPITVDGETDARAWDTTLTLSREEGLTLYDAAYLELAIRTSHALATCDVALIEAAGRRRIDVLTG